MKHKQKPRLIVTLFIAALMGAPAVAQTIPDPEFALRPYALASDGTLKDVERTDAKVEYKLIGGGYGGAKTYYTAFSGKSTVRFPSATPPRLFMKVEGGVDPADLILLSVGETQKDRRRFLVGNSSLYGKARDVSDSFIKVEFKKVRDGVYELVLPVSIAPGEYAIMPVSDGKTSSTTTKISCFGID